MRKPEVSAIKVERVDTAEGDGIQLYRVYARFNNFDDARWRMGKLVSFAGVIAEIERMEHDPSVFITHSWPYPQIVISPYEALAANASAA